MTEVTVVIPAYNSSRYIRATIESALTQDFPGVQVVVVDDGSSDDTAQMASSYPRVRVVSQSNAGDAAARETGLNLIGTEFVIFLDHDDLLHPSAARTHMGAFGPDLDMVFGSNNLIDSDGGAVGSNVLVPRRFSARDVVMGTTPSFSQCMYRVSALRRIGGFRAQVGSAADHDLNIRLLGADDRGFCHGSMVMSYRRHSGQQSYSPTRLYRALMLVIEEHVGAGGLLDDPKLLHASRRHWARYFGQFIPLEVLRALQSGRRHDALDATSMYFRNAPTTLVGTCDFIASRFAKGLSRTRR